MIFLLLTRYKVSKFLTRYYCRVIFRESTTRGQTTIVGNLVHWFRTLADATADPVVSALSRQAAPG